jgi:uncharacterized protein (DUF488 family)
LVDRLLTVGHGTHDRDGLGALLSGAGVGLVVDVRRFPGSRRNPDVHTDALAEWLPAAGIGYRWDPRLGGRRSIPAGQDPDVDGWWRVTAFRAYAAHMRTDEFRAGMTDLLAEDDEAAATAVMCSESLWWRCHRRLISDAALLLHDVPVEHLGSDGRLTPHRPSEGARVVQGDLRYDDSDPADGVDTRA